jgi:hypothetical protein
MYYLADALVLAHSCGIGTFAMRLSTNLLFREQQASRR